MPASISRSDRLLAPVGRRLAWLGRPDPWIALVLCTALAWVFLRSPVTYVGDSKYSLLLSESLLTRGSFVLDDYGIPREPLGKNGVADVDGDIYQIEVVNGHFYYYFPPGSSVLSAPFVWVMDHLGRPVVVPGSGFSPGNETKVQARLAAYLMALLGAVFYFTGRLVLPAGWSAVLALGACLATQIWSTASRALWTHTWGVLLLGGCVYLLLATAAGRRRLHPVLLANLLAWTYFVRPTNSLFIVAVSVYVALYAREIFLAYAVTGAAWFAGFAGWSWYHFGHLLPSYYRASRLGSPHFWEALAGNLVSPSRGLLVLVPAACWVAWLLARHWRRLEHRRLLVALLAAGVAQLLAVACFTPWNGGTCFGPRYSTELVPTLLLGAVLGVAALRRRRAEAGEEEHRLRGREWSATLAAGAAALAAGLWIHGRGANSLATVKWNLLPVSVDVDSARVWDWGYPQVLAGIVPMPAPAVWPVLAGRVNFGGGAALAYQGDGWSAADAGLCWTDDRLATLRFATGEHDISGGAALKMKLMPFLAFGKHLRRQRMEMSLNGRPIGTLELKTTGDQEVHVMLPPGALRARNVLSFGLPDATSPRSLGFSSDPRRLALAVSWMELEGR